MPCKLEKVVFQAHSLRHAFYDYLSATNADLSSWAIAYPRPDADLPLRPGRRHAD